MPINYDVLKQSHRKVAQAEAEKATTRQRETEEFEAHKINEWWDYMTQLGVIPERADIEDDKPVVYADGHKFKFSTFWTGHEWYYWLWLDSCKESIDLRFGSPPAKWDQGWREILQAEIFQTLESSKAQPPQNDEQPIDLMPTTLIMDDCEAAYDLLKQARRLVGEALDFCILNSTEDVKNALYQLSVRLADFLGEPYEPDFVDMPDDDSDLTEDDYPASVPAAAAPVDPFIALVRSGDFVVMDTETTGLGDDAEICQIAIIDSTGNVVLDTLVKPQKPIPTSATAIHHISNEMVKDAPIWLNVNEKVWQALHGKTVIVYNADYDFRLIAQSEKACEPLATSDWHTIKRECAMLKFAEIYGDWNDYHGNYRWQKLDKAARYYDLPVNAAHTALGDCLMTLAICKAMAAAE
jgi:DNA polymerase-3 subunit epsilon